MDAIPPLLTTGVPSVGVLGLLAWLVIRTMKQGGTDRATYTAELEAMTKRYDLQITELRTQITDLRAEIAQVRSELEVERKARHAAEDLAAEYRRLLDDATTPKR